QRLPPSLISSSGPLLSSDRGSAPHDAAFRCSCDGFWSLCGTLEPPRERRSPSHVAHGERAANERPALIARFAHQHQKHKETAMGLFSKDTTNMEDLFVHTLRDIYHAEKQIEKALPDMIEKSSEPQLKQGFQTHLQETKNHVKRLQQVFKL